MNKTPKDKRYYVRNCHASVGPKTIGLLLMSGIISTNRSDTFRNAKLVCYDSRDLVDGAVLRSRYPAEMIDHLTLFRSTLEFPETTMVQRVIDQLQDHILYKMEQGITD